jgi:formylglycine-generating enzyme required for sulfatase activity
MATLPTDLFDALRNTLAPHFETHDERKEILAPLFNWQPVYLHIDWAGDASEFTTRLIELLTVRQLSAVVQRLPVGDEQQQVLADLCHGLETYMPGASPDALEPGFGAYQQSLIDRHQRDRRWQIDARFVRLTLIKDLGMQTQGERYQEQTRKYDDLRLLLADTPYRVLVLLGVPGCGKTTLLRRLQLDDARDRLADGALRVSFLLPLNRYPLNATDPRQWLAEEWQKEAPHLPLFAELVRQGRVLLLLDALNELKHRDRDDLAERIAGWRDFLCEFGERGNRAVVTCRSIDYSEPLGSNDAPVQNANVKPLTPEQVKLFLQVHLPEQAEQVGQALEHEPKQLELFSTPYFLKLLCENDEVRRTGNLPTGHAALFTGLVRQALRRECDAQNPLLREGELLKRGDRWQVLNNHWADPHQLPEQGTLIPGLARLAYHMQRAEQGEGAQVRAGKDEAQRLIDQPRAEEVLQAGASLNVLDDDVAHGEVLFFHQLLQEYFAARCFARQPDYDLTRSEWRVESIRPSLAEVLKDLPDSEPLPPIPSTGWEETAQLAAAITSAPEAFVKELQRVNLLLAARCAAAPGVRVSAALKTEIQQALIGHTQDPKADLRARIAAGLALGELGDPRFERRTGLHGDYLLPPLLPVQGGTYTIGDEDSSKKDEKPAHHIKVPPFEMSRFPITNAEFALFIQAGGYEDEQWWKTEAAKAWRRGEGQVEGQRESWRDTRRLLMQWTEDDLRKLVQQNRATSQQVDDWLTIRAWTDDEFEAWLQRTFPMGEVYHLPRYWDDPAFNNPAQPVVGVCWHEVRAYCAWLSTQSKTPFRLPTEAEWEAAARGKQGRRYAYGPTFDAAKCNTFESHIRRTTPVGIFPGGETLEGIADLCGNVWEWTSSAYLDYPYAGSPEREDPARMDVQHRVLRGGSWYVDRGNARAAYRGWFDPDVRYYSFGFRVVSAPVSSL